MRLSVVIPALDEELRLPRTLDSIADYLEARQEWLPAEILVIDDGSTDGTAQVGSALRPREGVVLRSISHGRNIGKGAAVRTGFGTARGTSILLTDADLAAPIGGIESLAREATSRSVAIGSRAVDRRLISARQPRYRDLMGRSFNLVVQSLLLPGIGDTQCGFKLFPGDLGRQLASTQRIKGFAYDVEHLVLARRWGYEVREVAIEWSHVADSRVRPVMHSAQMLRDVMRLAWWRSTGQLPSRPPVAGAG